MGTFTGLQLGMANAWIGSAVILLTMAGVVKNRKLAKRLLDGSWHTPFDKKVSRFNTVLMFGMMLFTLWVPLKLGTAWFYAGLFLYLTAFACHGIALYNYAATPENEAITKGMYRISRNPLYLFYTLMFLGLITASLSLPLLVVWIIYNISTHLMILREERYCLARYTESYRAYMQKTPRYCLFF